VRGIFVLARVSALAGLLLALTLPAQGQTPPVAQSAPLYSPMQLDQLLAPVALYPDGLLGQILMAATYPLEIVQADRWRQDPANAALAGAQLVQALQLQPWDQSVKSLVAFPQVLNAMDNNLSWTEELGDAFVAQQADVMDRVQQLRARAQAARTLVSTPQQTVTDADQAIEINPAGPDTVYVPEYDPNLVYGDWPYYDNPPDDFELADYNPGGFLGFAILLPLWGWNSWDWRHHRIGLGPATSHPQQGPGPARRSPTWRHDPAHRHGVPYRESAARVVNAGPGNAASAAPGDFRGYAPAQTGATTPGFSNPRGAATLPRSSALPELRPNPPAPAQPRYTPAPEQRRAPPALESFGRGVQVQIQEQRGASSRMSTPSVSAHPGGARERR
jgi:hypothetical protein